MISNNQEKRIKENKIENIYKKIRKENENNNKK